jgi:predicted 3-demethylubiquinone-9 3-methyltransferase (glyoxalase superfamily)
MQNITPCLWFDTQAEEAAHFYISIFPNSKIKTISRYSKAGQEFHRKEPGSVMTVAFELDSREFTGLNGGPLFQFSEAISFQVMCDTQQEVDHFWEKLSADGGQQGQCGWLKDKFGVSWQIVPTALPKILGDPDPAKSQRAMTALMQMKKLDIDVLKKAAEGK